LVRKPLDGTLAGDADFQLLLTAGLPPQDGAGRTLASKGFPMASTTTTSATRRDRRRRAGWSAATVHVMHSRWASGEEPGMADAGRARPRCWWGRGCRRSRRL